MRTVVGGILVALMMCLTLLGDITGQPIFTLIAGITGWFAAVILFVDVKVSLRWQTGLLTVGGIVLLLCSSQRGDFAQWFQAVANNTGIVSMLAAVGFLRLITLPVGEARNAPLPTGFAAFVRTLAGVSLFGSVINISAPIIFADRLHEHKALGRLASQSITRIFTSTSAWSPFFGGMAAVVTYVPAMRLGFVVLACIPFAMVSFIVVIVEVKLRYSKSIHEFKGYPVNFYNLWIPAALASIILLLSRLAPDWSVLTWISLAALSLSATVLCFRHGVGGAGNTLGQFVVRGLPAMINELQLFLAAGVLAAGLAAIINSASLPLLVDFGVTEASMLLAAMILLAAVGVHPVVTISGMTPLIMTLEPNADLLAICYLLAWGLGTCASPLSGTHLVFQGRYGIPSIQGAFWNWPYVALMYLFAVVLLQTVARVL